MYLCDFTALKKIIKKKKNKNCYTPGLIATNVDVTFQDGS